eukprot:763062-Alexandrium_andersonii.AAC.1
MRKWRNRLTRSNLELREPRNGLKICTRSSRGVRPVRLFAQISNPPMETELEGGRGREITT